MPEPRSTGLDRLGYRLLVTGLTPLVLVYTLWAAVRLGGGLRYLRQRLGLFGRGPGCDIWLHAASVGEINAALPLLRLLRARYPGRTLLVTTNTPSGATALAGRLPGVTHAYLPFDRRRAVSRFLARFRPGCALIMETEIWPNLYRACAARDLPLVIVNGRLSQRTLKRGGDWLKRLYAEALGQVAAVLSRAECDHAGFLRLGAPAERCQVVGNIKFAALDRTAPPAPMALGRPYVLAASTREDEEALLLRAWRGCGSGGRLLVVVPRHPQRLPDILLDLRRLGARVAVRSRGDAVTTDTEVYLADTFGELTAFMAGAELVIMGGSLVAKGGQNLLEPAALGRPVLVGPHMENFATETHLLVSEEAALQVGSVEALQAQLDELLNDAARREALGRRAQAVVEARRDMAERYLTAIEPFCGPGAEARAQR